MPNNAIVLDLETIPDPAVWQAADVGPPPDPNVCENCGGPVGEDPPKCTKMTRGKCRAAKAKAAKDEFPPPYAHKIVCCGLMLVTDYVPKGMVVWTADPNDETSERGLLKALNDLIKATEMPDLITWGGRNFDIPVIEARSIRHAVPQPWYDGSFRNHKDDGANVDLMNVYTGGRYGSFMKMHDAARLIGLPGKNGVDGSMVKALVEAGQLETVKGYCATDVVQTTFLYLRHLLIRGYVDATAYGESLTALVALYKGQPGFESFVTDDRWLQAK